MKAFLKILSILALLVGMVKTGFLPPQLLVPGMLALVIIMALGNAMGTGLASTILSFALPILSIWALALYYGDGSMNTLVSLLAFFVYVALAFFGVYVMLSGPFRK